MCLHRQRWQSKIIIRIAAILRYPTHPDSPHSPFVPVFLHSNIKPTHSWPSAGISLGTFCSTAASVATSLTGHPHALSGNVCTKTNLIAETDYSSMQNYLPSLPPVPSHEWCLVYVQPRQFQPLIVTVKYLYRLILDLPHGYSDSNVLRRGFSGNVQAAQAIRLRIY